MIVSPAEPVSSLEREVAPVGSAVPAVRSVSTYVVRRWVSSSPPLLQQVDVIELGGFASPGLLYSVVHLPHPVDHLVGPLPLGKELAFCS